ncbi:hypothetical protein GYMLUDRAFT_280483 [Collybiopsis luxurians FD-317 M1]|nr:hypothetical protein GYMLUDRAFT_280483 [Collybiopsis luxurians FD-317 M1]
MFWNNGLMYVSSAESFFLFGLLTGVNHLCVATVKKLGIHCIRLGSFRNTCTWVSKIIVGM